MPDDPWNDPETKEWMAHVRENVAPKVHQSMFTISLLPDKPEDVDLKFAVELGLTLCYDKPLLLVISPGVKVPGHLVRCADEIVEWDGTGDPMAKQQIVDAIDRIMEANQ